MRWPLMFSAGSVCAGLLLATILNVRNVVGRPAHLYSVVVGPNSIRPTHNYLPLEQL